MTFKWPHISVLREATATWLGTRTLYVDMTLTHSKVKINLTGLLNFRQLAKPCMLAAMTAAPLRGFLVRYSRQCTFELRQPVVNLSALIDLIN